MVVKSIKLSDCSTQVIERDGEYSWVDGATKYLCRTWVPYNIYPSARLMIKLPDGHPRLSDPPPMSLVLIDGEPYKSYDVYFSRLRFTRDEEFLSPMIAEAAGRCQALFKEIFG